MPKGMPIDLVGGLCIRTYHDGDLRSLARNANDRRIAANLRDGFPHPYTEHHARTYLARVAAHWPPLAYAIADGNAVIGGIGILPGEDVHRRTAELGYWLAVPYWGRGIMSRAVRTFTEWAFVRFDLLRVHASVYQTNPASARVLENAGFRFEGRLRSSVVKYGRLADQLVYARIRRRSRAR
jgi:RimJ/RimL family protein N-acetyltransferase